MIRISADSTLHGCLLYKALSYKSAEDEDQGMFNQRQKHSMRWYHSSAKWDGKENGNHSYQVFQGKVLRNTLPEEVQSLLFLLFLFLMGLGAG
jgi:hypothetical protein